MRALVIAGLMAIGFGLAGVSASSAAPANGIVIGNAAEAAPLIEQVRWWRHRRFCWRHPYNWRCR